MYDSLMYNHETRSTVMTFFYVNIHCTCRQYHPNGESFSKIPIGEGISEMRQVAVLPRLREISTRLSCKHSLHRAYADIDVHVRHEIIMWK